MKVYGDLLVQQWPNRQLSQKFAQQPKGYYLRVLYTCGSLECRDSSFIATYSAIEIFSSMQYV
jgi:hypothetical protein